MDSLSSNLQVPDPSAGPSRAPRPASVQPMPSSASPSASGRKRASHSVVTGHQQEEQPTYRDVYSHPAALEYAAAHPRRTIPKFGPYLLLRTLGEGEFGKVKLGLHMQWGEEVAVKLIRRGSVDSSVRMSKVEREIEVLRTLKHPNIVRLYDVIETDKYIGIILEYASGGELFDHILAHRYLREKDACKLFCQLISGVWYIHQKKIVHRDLKLENLLLDRHRNVIITDFGFANRFEHRADDLMQTSCGSPCYAAPELVISDGAYVGSAVDVWSCGVILYAMLAGYLPFDDDPANPDGDNINLLYKYIVNTPLSFPDYISAEARDLLSIMLVPDPEHRANLQAIMEHQWLAPYAHLFDRTVDELEEAAMEQHRQKRLAYQKQMRQAATESPSGSNKISRTQSAAIPNGQHSSRHRAQPEYLYETSGDQSMYSTGSPASARRGYNSVVVPPTSAPMGLEDDPFAPSPSQEVPSISIPAPSADGVQEEPRARKSSRASERKAPPSAMPATMPPEGKSKKSGFRHTIQVEVGESQQDQQPAHHAIQQPAEQPKQPMAEASPRRSSSARAPAATTTPERRSSRRTAASSEQMAAKPLPVTPAKAPAGVEEPVIQVTSPPVSPPQESKSAHAQQGTGSSSGSVSSRGKHSRGISMDKIGKMFGSSSESTPLQTNGHMSRSPSQKSSPAPVSSTEAAAASATGSMSAKRPSTLQPLSPAPSRVQPTDPALLSPETPSSAKKNRRNTLTSIMTEQFKLSLKQRSKGKASPAESPVRSQEKVVSPPADQEKEKERAPEPEIIVPATPAKPPVPPKENAPPATPRFVSPRPDVGAVPASTVKANKVMQWFRLKSKGKAPADVISDNEQPVLVERPTNVPMDNAAAASTSTVNQSSAATEKLASPVAVSGHPSRGPSSAADASFSEKTFANVWGRGSSKGTIRMHHGAVDPSITTTGYPPDVMQQVKKVLEEMGVDIQIEGEYKYRCVRPKRRKAAGGAGLGLRDTGSGLAAFTMTGSAASNGVDKRGLPVPSQSHGSFGSATTGMLKGWMMRRQSSQTSTAPGPDTDVVAEAAMTAATANTDAPASISGEPIYGSPQHDQGDEVRFSVELTRLDRLEGTYSLDIRRLKGNLRSYKFLYDAIRDRANLQR